MSTRLHTELLAHAGRLLLEYNESTGVIHDALASTARSLPHETCQINVSYGGVSVSLDGVVPVLFPVRELRYNTAVQARVRTILALACSGKTQPADALAQLKSVEADTPRQSRWLAILVLGAAASCLAALLGADAGTEMVVGLSTGLGLFVRQELGGRNYSVLVLPLAAAFLGAIIGGISIRLGWTATPELVLIVPALMLVPGPHLINGLLDLIDNYLLMSVARLTLATGILFASALGIVIGIEVSLQSAPLPDAAAEAVELKLFSVMFLAGVVTCGFAVFYNTPWLLVGFAVIGGMIGNGIRFLALDFGCTLAVATFAGSFAIGVVSALMARSGKTPIAVVAFAGAVTMMPGLQIYRALSGALHLARFTQDPNTATISTAAANALQASLLASALALGLILGARATMMLIGKPVSPSRARCDDGAN